MDLMFGLFAGSIVASYFSKRSKRRCQLLYHTDGEMASLFKQSGEEGEALKSLLLNYGPTNWIWKYIDYVKSKQLWIMISSVMCTTLYLHVLIAQDLSLSLSLSLSLCVCVCERERERERERESE